VYVCDVKYCTVLYACMRVHSLVKLRVVWCVAVCSVININFCSVGY